MDRCRSVPYCHDALLAAERKLNRHWRFARGQEPRGLRRTTRERLIVVGRGKDGQPTGTNVVNRKPEYFDRIAALEAAVKAAEENVANAEKDFRQNAPK